MANDPIPGTSEEPHEAWGAGAWEDEVLEDFGACCGCVDEAHARRLKSLLAVGRPQTQLPVVLDLLGRGRHRNGTLVGDGRGG
jgi:hypothetical protein